ncbi:MAG TPA: hypothetical protein VLE47_04010 [Candidatus Saccharimonadales bacterium]|nr:hypothetical protein [Candidatus Saccharimonadales bacterium]
MFLYILPTILLTALSSLVFLFIANYTSPRDASGNLILINTIYFFVSAFVSLAGFFTLLLYSVSSLRRKSSEKAKVEKIHTPKIDFRRSLRHGVLASSTIVGIGLLNALQFANPLNIILLISAFLLIEIYFFGH